MSRWRDVHAGYVVLGADGHEWGVLAIEHHAGTSTVTLIRYGQRVTGHPPSDSPVIITQVCDLTDMHNAAAVLAAAGFHMEILSEQWESA